MPGKPRWRTGRSLGGNLADDILKRTQAQRSSSSPPAPRRSGSCRHDPVLHGEDCRVFHPSRLRGESHNPKPHGFRKSSRSPFANGFAYVSWVAGRTSTSRVRPRLSFFVNAHNSTLREIASTAATARARRVLARCASVIVDDGATTKRSVAERSTPENAGVSRDPPAAPVNIVPQPAIEGRWPGAHAVPRACTPPP